MAADDEQEKTEDNWKWPRAATLLLLELYRSKKEDFNNPKKKKKTLWRSIADQMCEKGHNVKPEHCDKKMRNLKQTYKTVKENNSKSGRSKRTWEFYDLMDEIFSKDPTIELPNIKQTTRVARAEPANQKGTNTSFSPDSDIVEPETEVEVPTPSTSTVTPTGIRSQIKQRKRQLKSEGLAVALEKANELEEKKIKAMNDMTDAINRGNSERVQAIRELTGTLKQLIEKS